MMAHKYHQNFIPEIANETERGFHSLSMYSSPTHSCTSQQHTPVMNVDVVVAAADPRPSRSRFIAAGFPFSNPNFDDRFAVLCAKSIEQLTII